jgi:hypothetical protein
MRAVAGIKGVPAGEMRGFVKAIIKRLGEYRGLVRIDELSALEEAVPVLERHFNAAVSVGRAEESREAKAKNALPGKPAILLE